MNAPKQTDFPELLQRLHLHEVDLITLIETKRAAGRPKDIEAIAELEAILEEQEEW